MAKIPVTWNNGKPYAGDIIVHGKNETKIFWEPDKEVIITHITKPKDSDNPGYDDFTHPEPVGSSGKWKCRDTCEHEGDFDYEIMGHQPSGTAQEKLDPRITNDH